MAKNHAKLFKVLKNRKKIFCIIKTCKSVIFAIVYMSLHRLALDNARAYIVRSVSDEEKRFITLTTGRPSHSDPSGEQDNHPF